MAATAVGESRRPFIISHASIRTTAGKEWQDIWQKQQCDADGDCMMMTAWTRHAETPQPPLLHN
jgi:hypothetical protein